MNFDELRRAIEVMHCSIIHEPDWEQKHTALATLTTLEREHAERERRLREAIDAQGHDTNCDVNDHWSDKPCNCGHRKLAEILNSPAAAPSRGQLIEQLAEYAHRAWSGWMSYLFRHSKTTPGGTTIPFELADRWLRQLNTHYTELSEDEKESDRKEARCILAIIFDSPTTAGHSGKEQIQEERKTV